MFAMKFRAKFGVHNLLWAAMGVFSLSHTLLRGHTDFFHEYFLILALVWALPPLTHWWKITEEGLLQKSSWGSRSVPWSEITRVSNWPGPEGKGVQIDHARPAPLSDRGTIYASPANRDGFLAELKRHAPHAQFEVAPEDEELSILAKK